MSWGSQSDSVKSGRFGGRRLKMLSQDVVGVTKFYKLGDKQNGFLA